MRSEAVGRSGELRTSPVVMERVPGRPSMIDFGDVDFQLPQCRGMSPQGILYTLQTDIRQRRGSEIDIRQLQFHRLQRLATGYHCTELPNLHMGIFELEMTNGRREFRTRPIARSKNLAFSILTKMVHALFQAIIYYQITGRESDKGRDGEEMTDAKTSQPMAIIVKDQMPQFWERCVRVEADAKSTLSSVIAEDI